MIGRAIDMAREAFFLKQHGSWGNGAVGVNGAGDPAGGSGSGSSSEDGAAIFHYHLQHQDHRRRGSLEEEDDEEEEDEEEQRRKGPLQTLLANAKIAAAATGGRLVSLRRE